MDSEAAITCQPCYYTHYHSAPGHGCHASPLAVPWTAPAGKTTGNRYNYITQGPSAMFRLQPHYLCCWLHIALVLFNAAWVVLRALCLKPRSEPAPVAHPRSTPVPSPSSAASLAQLRAGGSPCQTAAGSWPPLSRR